ncbi:hypothetical protein D3C77_586270 [compost metagenome]
MTLERPLQVGLVGKPGFQCHFGDQCATTQPGPGILHALIQQVAVRRQTELLLECTDQVRSGQPGCGANVLQAQRLGAVLTDEGGSCQQARIDPPHPRNAGGQSLDQFTEKNT